MNILAWAAIILTILNVILMPLVFGRERPDFSYSTWVTAIIETIVVCLLALRVLQII